MYRKEFSIEQLHKLRVSYERNRTLSLEVYCTIYDICGGLSLSAGETQYILGPAYLVILDLLGVTDEC